MNLPDAIATAERSVVQVSFQLTGPRGETARQLEGARFHRHVLGTGFLVDDEGHVVTAKHVVDAGLRLFDSVDAGTKDLMVGLAAPNLESIRASFAAAVAGIVAEDPANDLTILKMGRKPSELDPTEIGDQPIMQGHVPATLATSRPRDGDSIAISGYPLNNAVLITSAGAIASSWDFTRPGMLDRYLADVEVNAATAGGRCTASQTRQ